MGYLKLFIIFILFLSCRDSDKAIGRNINIKFEIDNKEIDLNNEFKIYIVNKNDTTIVLPIKNKINIPRVLKQNDYQVNFIYKDIKLKFDDFSEKILNPNQETEWFFGLDNYPLDVKKGVLYPNEYLDTTIVKIEFFKLNLMEEGDGIQKVNIFRK